MNNNYYYYCFCCCYYYCYYYYYYYLGGDNKRKRTLTLNGLTVINKGCMNSKIIFCGFVQDLYALISFMQ